MKPVASGRGQCFIAGLSKNADGLQNIKQWPIFSWWFGKNIDRIPFNEAPSI